MKNGKFVLHHSRQKKGQATYIYYQIAWYFRRDGKPYRNIIRNLGRLKESEIDYYRNAVACINNDPVVFPCKLDQLRVRVSRDYLPSAIGNHFWNHWELFSVFQDLQSRKEVSTNDIAKILTIIRLVKPSSKSYTIELYPETCLPELIGVKPSAYNKSRIFRELEIIESCKDRLGKHIFEIAKKKNYTKGELLFYDLSSGNITGLKCVLARWGHCKDGYRTHVVLMLVITPEGYPVYWEILEGNTADANTIEGLTKKIEKIFGKIDSVLCFDRGMVSDDNLKLLEKKEIPVITALDGNQVQYFESCIDFPLINKVKKMDIEKEDAEIQKQLTQDGFVFALKNLYYKELNLTRDQEIAIEKKTTKLNLQKRRYFLSFNPELAYLSQKHRKSRVEGFKKWVKEYNKELSQALGNRKKETIEKEIKKKLKRHQIANVVIKYNLTKYRVENKNNKGSLKKAWTYTISLNRITAKSYKVATKYDGLWILLTNIKKQDDINFFNKTGFNSFFEIYRLKNTIEESFKIISDFVEVEPFYVYKPKHIKAHFTICVLSYLLDSTILNKIRASKKIENMSLHSLFRILKNCKQDVMQLGKGTSVAKLTEVSDKQTKILKILGCSHLISSEYLQTHNIISIERNRA